MIRYSLKCSDGHNFESWFASSDAYERLIGAKALSCAICGGNQVSKAIMAPRVAKGGETERDATPSLSQPASPAEQALRELRKKVEANSEDVGRQFATEARAIHSGEAPERSIYGEARMDEARALLEDGVPVAPLPWSNRRSN